MILILSTSIILKRKAKFYRILFGALFGSLSIFILFIRLNSIQLFIYKFLISIVMIIISFGFKDIRYFFKNIYYLYIISILFGGIMSFFNNNYKQTSKGLLFINNNSPNLLFVLVLSIIVLYIYLKQIKNLKCNYNKYYDVEIKINNKNIILTGFLDTGNKLKDPYKNRPIILIEKKLIDTRNLKTLLIPFSSVNNSGLIECIKSDNITINGYKINKNYLIGFMDNINIDGISCILNEKILEGIK